MPVGEPYHQRIAAAMTPQGAGGLDEVLDLRRSNTNLQPKD